MQVHHGVMPSHTMYALNMERVLSRLWHPSHEELEQDHVHRQRIAAKEGVLVSWEPPATGLCTDYGGYQEPNTRTTPR